MRRPIALVVVLSAAVSFAADGPDLSGRTFVVSERVRASELPATPSLEAGTADSTSASSIDRRPAEPIAKVQPPRAPEKNIPTVQPIEPLAAIDRSIAVTVRVVPGTFAQPAVFALWQNQPNPASGSTLIRYSLGIEAQVSIEVFSLQGSRVATLVDGLYGAGQHAVEWKGLDENGNPVRSGVYFYRMKSGSFVQTKKLILQR